MGVSRTSFVAADVDGTHVCATATRIAPARAASSRGAFTHFTPAHVTPVFRRRLWTTLRGFATGAVWLVISRLTTAAPIAAWSLLPQPAHVRLAPSGMVKIADGALIAVRGADREQVQPIVDRFVQLVANTRGLRLSAATTADAHPAI